MLGFSFRAMAVFKSTCCNVLPECTARSMHGRKEEEQNSKQWSTLMARSPPLLPSNKGHTISSKMVNVLSLFYYCCWYITRTKHTLSFHLSSQEAASLFNVIYFYRDGFICVGCMYITHTVLAVNAFIRKYKYIHTGMESEETKIK